MKTNNKSTRSWLMTLMVCISVALTGCLGGSDGGGDGGGDGGAKTTSGTLGGTAAVGNPIVNGAVSVSCADGTGLLTTTTDANGAWQVTLSGQNTLPCAVEVAGGTVNGATNATAYHSIAMVLNTVVNVTPLTDMIVSNLAGTSSLVSWFQNLASTPAILVGISQASIEASLARLRTALAGLPPLATNDPISMALTAMAGTTGDDMLSALAAAMNSAGMSYSAMMANAAMPTFPPFSASFTVALGNAWAATVSGGGNAGGGNNGGGNNGGASGSYTLLVTVNAMGMTTQVTFDNVPKPNSEEAFCSDSYVNQAINDAAAAGGQLTINSCTFDGTHGQISATLTITSPVAMTVPYTVDYLYQ